MWVLFALAGLVAFAAGMLAGYLAGRSRRERSLFDAQIDAFERRIEANRAPRHAARSPRGTPGHPAPGTPPRAVTTAADIAPVFLPAPGVSIPLRPQPGRDSGDGTGTLPRLTDTGELRAISERADEFIARLQREGNAYRKELMS